MTKCNQYKWYLTKRGYVQTRRGIRIHRLILGIDNPKIGIDHINHNLLDNRKQNLRICNQSENGGNRLKNKTQRGRKPTSQYKGVYWDKSHKCWRVGIKKDGKRIYVEYFKNEDEAALAYNKHTVEIFGEFAKLNEVKPLSLENFFIQDFPESGSLEWCRSNGGKITDNKYKLIPVWGFKEKSTSA